MPFEYSIIYYKNAGTKLIKTTYREFIMNSCNWIHNRKIDENKVNLFLRELTNNSIKIGWTFHSFLDKSTGEIKLLDGQHRREAIKKFLEISDIDMSNNDEITLWVYEIENELSCEEEIINLFITINNNEPIDETMLPSRRKMNLWRMICNNQVLKSGITKNMNTIKSRAPFISPKEVKTIIDKLLARTHLNQLEDDEIIEKLKEINNKISLMAGNENLPQLFNRERITKKERDIIEEARKIKFFLKIPGSIYEDFKWIELL